MLVKVRTRVKSIFIAFNNQVFFLLLPLSNALYYSGLNVEEKSTSQTAMKSFVSIHSFQSPSMAALQCLYIAEQYLSL